MSAKRELDAGMLVTPSIRMWTNSHDVQRVTLTPRDALGRVVSETVREFDDLLHPSSARRATSETSSDGRDR